jgi:hypothetical protein
MTHIMVIIHIFRGGQEIAIGTSAFNPNLSERVHSFLTFAHCASNIIFIF